MTNADRSSPQDRPIHLPANWIRPEADDFPLPDPPDDATHADIKHACRPDQYAPVLIAFIRRELRAAGNPASVIESYQRQVNSGADLINLSWVFLLGPADDDSEVGPDAAAQYERNVQRGAA